MEWTMTNEFYDLYLTNGFYIDFENYKSNPNNSPLIDEQTGEWIEFPDLAW